MDLLAYRFDVAPALLEKTGFKETDEREEHETKANFENRLGIINSFFSGEEDLNYMLGNGHQPVFRHGYDLTLRRYKVKGRGLELEDDKEDEYEDALMKGDLQTAQSCIKTTEEVDYSTIPKSDSDTFHAARIIYHKEDITILRVQKKRPIKGEDKNYQTVEYKENYVSSLVIVVAKPDCQYILIEDVKRTFAPATVSLILECTLNRLLMAKYHLMCTVSPIRRLSDFWAVLNANQQEGRSVMRLKFRFDFPNMPWNDNLLGFRFKEIGRDLEAEAEVLLKGHLGQPLKLNTKTGEQNPEVNDLARYSCNKGNMCTAYYSDHTQSTFGNRQTGEVKVQLSDGLRELQKNTQPELFPEEYTKGIVSILHSLQVLNR